MLVTFKWLVIPRAFGRLSYCFLWGSLINFAVADRGREAYVDVACDPHSGTNALVLCLMASVRS
jgi:hypothetical protein